MVQLAFVAQELPIIYDRMMDVKDIPNKVGGLPIWLDHPLKSVKCHCGQQMPLLLQLYAPEDYPECAFHRVVYLFCCKNGSCHSKNAFKVYRSQLPLKNSRYDIEGNLKAKDNAYCHVCGLLGSLTCGNCRNVLYCSKEHQQLDWTHGHHKKYCESQAEIPQLVIEWVACFRFPELLLEEEEEPEKLPNLSTLDLDYKIEEGDKELEDEEETETEVDKAFLKFQKQISLAPDQVLRYGRVLPDGNADPLWVSDIGRDVEIPPCDSCKAPRTFEFQVIVFH